jgi:hypothetical protein
LCGFQADEGNAERAINDSVKKTGKKGKERKGEGKKGIKERNK